MIEDEINSHEKNLRIVKFLSSPSCIIGDKIDLINQIKQYISIGEDINQTLNGITPLHLAIKLEKKN